MTEIVRVEGPIAAQVIAWLTARCCRTHTGLGWWSPWLGQGPANGAPDDVDAAFLPQLLMQVMHFVLT